MTARVAVLGTGRMGGTIARRLAATGHELTVWDRTRQVAEKLGVGRVADTPAAAAAESDVVITSLTGPDAVKSVYLGPSGAVESAKGKIFIDMSTAGPEVEDEIEPVLRSHGAELLTVPIIGAPTAVAAGSALLLVGGDESAFESARPVLEQLGTVQFVGTRPDAALLKLIANSMLAIVATGAAEQVTGERAGLDPEIVFSILARQAPGLAARQAGFIGLPQPTLFAMRDLHKDLVLASANLPAHGGPVSLLNDALKVVDEATGQTPNEDVSAVVRLYRRPSDRAAS